MSHGTQAKMFRDGNGIVLKDMRGGAPWKIHREYELQFATYQFVPRVPKPLYCKYSFLFMEDLGQTEWITDLDKCLEEAEVLLEGLKQAEVRHNDLQPGNIIIRDNVPYAVDFGWAQWMHDEPYPGQPSDRKALPQAIQLLYEKGERAVGEWSWT